MSPYNNCYVTFDYDMQDGRTLRRRFTINGTCELARKFDTLYNSPGFLLSREVIPGELKQSDFAGGAIQGYDKNNEPYYYNLSSKEAYEALHHLHSAGSGRFLDGRAALCQLPDDGDCRIQLGRHLCRAGYVRFLGPERSAFEPHRGNLFSQLLLRPHGGRRALLAYAEAHGFLVP